MLVRIGDSVRLADHPPAAQSDVKEERWFGGVSLAIPKEVGHVSSRGRRGGADS